MTKHKFDDLPEFHQWVIVGATATTEELESALSKSGGDGFEITICINGEEVGLDFIDTMSRFESQMDSMVKHEAKDMLAEKFGNLVQHLMDADQYAKDNFETWWSESED